MENSLYLGIDLGTSGCRASVIDARGAECASARVTLPAPARHGPAYEQDPAVWWNAVRAVLADIAKQIPLARVRRLAIDGTSGTLLLTDEAGTPLAPALLYNDARAVDEAARIAAAAPAASGAHGASSALAKLLWLQQQSFARHARHALDQAAFIAAQFTGRFDVSDENNALKLGYGIVDRRWPDWLDALAVPRAWLPRIMPPGTPIGVIKEELRREFGFAADAQIVAGTTDSIAAFLATGATQPGEAVTALGSTLVLKVIAAQPVFAPASGIYSHRLGDVYLAGGASNSGGAVLLQHFTREELLALTPCLDPARPTGLDYYPLPAPGERFPVNDPHRAPRLTPRPDDPARFLQALFEGMARIEAQGYRRLAELGAPYPVSVRTTGGGAVNSAWTHIRARELGVPLPPARHTEAAHGAARLAAGSLSL